MSKLKLGCQCGHLLFTWMEIMALIAVAACVFQVMSTYFLFMRLVLTKGLFRPFEIFAYFWLNLAFICYSLSSFCGLLTLWSVWSSLALLFTLTVLVGYGWRLLLLRGRSNLLIWLICGLVLRKEHCCWVWGKARHRGLLRLTNLRILTEDSVLLCLLPKASKSIVAILTSFENFLLILLGIL